MAEYKVGEEIVHGERFNATVVEDSRPGHLDESGRRPFLLNTEQARYMVSLLPESCLGEWQSSPRQLAQKEMCKEIEHILTESYL